MEQEISQITTEARTILIIEDEEAISNALRDQFQLEGFQVAVAQNGQLALSMLATQKSNVILLDLNMPQMDGMTFLRKLRQTQYGAKTPVIVLTNSEDPNKIAEGLELGVYDFLIKANTSLDALVAKVKEKLF